MLRLQQKPGVFDMKNIFLNAVPANPQTTIEQSMGTFAIPECLPVEFGTGIPQTREFRTYFVWYGHCRAALADRFGCFVRTIHAMRVHMLVMHLIT